MNLLDLPSDIIYYIIMNFLIIPDKKGIITNTLYNLFLSNGYFQSLLTNDMGKIKYFYTPIYSEYNIDIRTIKTYKLPNGNIHGEYKCFEQDKLLTSGQSKNNKEVGYWQTYHITTGTLRSEGYYINGNAIGIYRYYYSSGKLMSEKYFDINGLLQNLLIIYHENGKIREKIHFKDNKRSGKYKKYSEYDVLEISCIYSNGLLNGLSTEYYSSGTLFTKGCYNNGKRVGIWNRYFKIKLLKPSAGITIIWFLNILNYFNENFGSFPDVR